MPPLLSLVMIVKDEAGCIEKVLDSVIGCVDRIVILDTGSTDRTPDLVKAWMARTNVPGDVFSEPFVDFATTRNRSLDLAEPLSQFSLILSGDEYVEGGEALRSYLQSSPPAAGAYNVAIVYGPLRFDSPRVIRNEDRWRYKGVVHEVLVGPSGPSPHRVPGVSIAHRDSNPQRKNDRRYKDLELLHKLHEKEPNDPRTCFYLGQTLGELGFYHEAIEVYRKRIALGGWHEEVYESMYRIGQLSERMGSPWAESQQRYLEAYNHSPHRAEPLFAIAMHYYLAREWPLAFFFATKGAAMPFPEHATLFVQHAVYKYQLHDLVAISGFYLGPAEREEGLRSAKIVAEVLPDDPRVRKNLELYEVKPPDHRV